MKTLGSQLIAELVDQGVTLGDSGVVHKDGAEVFHLPCCYFRQREMAGTDGCE